MPSLVGLLAGCGSDSPSPPSQESGAALRIVTVSGAPLQANAGDAVPLKVVAVDADGGTNDLPAGASVCWTSPAVVTALPVDSNADSPLPAPGPLPTAGWIVNPGRPERAGDLANVLFVFDPGTTANPTLTVSATVTGSVSGEATAAVPISTTPAGDATRGAAVYGASGANCAECHGATGHGSPEGSDATTFTIVGGTYDFPVPGLNSEDGNVAGDPAWTPALLAVAARSDMDNEGVTLRAPMPDWLTQANPATGAPPTTQDFADIFAFLKTQSR